MIPLKPVGLFALDRVRRDPRCMTRMVRMLRALGRDEKDVTWITEENLPEAAAHLCSLWQPDAAGRDVPPGYTRPLVFTTMEWGGRRTDLRPYFERCPDGVSKHDLATIFGQMTPVEDQHPHARDRQNNAVCWPTMNFGTMVGCPHGCRYCGQGRAGKYIAVMLNLEDYMEEVVGPVIETYPWNKVFRMILQGADLITFEPEYGLFDLFTRKLAQYEGVYGCFHTASSHVNWVEHLPRRDRLIGVWSVTADAVARDFEPGAGAALARFDAARKCRQWGVPVRYKFKPIIPVRNWREEYAKAIEYALRHTEPESIGFCLYIWHSFEDMARTLPLDLLDPTFVDAARKQADAMRGKRQAPFPHELRKEVYRFMIHEVRRWNSDVPLYVCTESREMWNELQEELGQNPRAYVCGCSSVAVPGRRLALSPAFLFSTYHPSPV